MKLRVRALDLRRRDGDAIAFTQNLICRARLTINADQIVARLGGADLTLEQLGDCRAVGDVHVVSESATVVVDDQNLHMCPFTSCVEWEIDIVDIKSVAAPAVVAFDVARRF
jgi:hypothetical protein